MSESEQTTTIKTEPIDIDESERSELARMFTGIAGCDDERATVFLENANWDLESALAMYYQELSGDEDDEVVINDDEVVINDDEVVINDDDTAGQASTSAMDTPSTSSASVKKWQPPTNRIVTFSSLTKTNKKQDIVPSLPQVDSLKAMLEAGQRSSSTSVPSGSNNENSTNAIGATNFLGTGYRLGMTENDTEVIPGPTMVQIWRNGFTVNGSELFSTKLPENNNFLHSLLLGKKISELNLKKFNATKTGKLYVFDRKHEEYKPKKKLLKESTHLSESSAPEAIETLEEIPNETAARAEVPLLPDVPTTTLHIRLADGTRLEAKFNHNHSVRDIRRYIIAARPSFAYRPFKLQLSFPPKTLDHDKQTLSEAGLLNTVVFQRLG